MSAEEKVPDELAERLPVRTVVKKYIVQNLIRLATQPGHEGKLVLILDEATMPIVSAAFSMSELVEAGCSLVERLETPRQRLPGFPAVYFIKPSARSVDHIMEDFKTVIPRVEKRGFWDRLMYCGVEAPAVDTFMYSDVHIGVLHALPDDLRRRLITNSILKAHLRAIFPVDLNFQALERNVFSLGMSDCMLQLYGNHSGGGLVMEAIARKLLSLCVVLHEYPYIRYKANHWTQRVAERLQQMLDDFLETNRDFWFHGAASVSDRGTLLLLDRSEDVLAPLMHETTYQAMVHDVLGLESGGVYEYEAVLNSGARQKKKCVLNDDDELWVRTRHMVIQDAEQLVIANLRTLQESNAAAKAQQRTEESMGLSEIQDVVGAVTDLQQETARNYRHKTIIGDCVRLFMERKLVELTTLEQVLTTGVTEDGNVPTAAELKDWVMAVVQEPGRREEDRARLLAVYFITQPISADERRDLQAAAHLSNAMKNALVNLSYLGVRLQTAEPEKRRARDPVREQQLERAKQEARAAKHKMCRFTPALKGIVQRHVQDALLQEQYPYLKPPPPPAASDPNSAQRASKSVRRTAGIPGPSRTFQAKAQRASPTETRPGGRTIVFVGGGATLSESREMARLADELERNIVFGATSIMGPQSFLDRLQLLDPELSAGMAPLEVAVQR